MNVLINKSVPSGIVTAPPSKSFAQRALICGAFSKKTYIRNIAFCEDVKALISCLSKLGAVIAIKENSVEITKIDINKIKDNTVLDCKENATSLRFLIPICLTLGKKIIFTGSKRLLERPLDDYKTFCDENGFFFDLQEDKLSVFGKMTCGDYIISGEKSSQVISGMLLALSLLEGKRTLTVAGNRVSQPYVAITKSVLNDFGISVNEDENKYTIIGKTTLDNADFSVEGDCSNAAFIEALSFLGGNVSVIGLKEDTLQGDIVFRKFYNDIKTGKKEFSVKNCPDLAPILYTVSCLFGGGTFFDTNRLMYKESDRNLSLKKELYKFGVNVEIFDDKVVIDAKNLRKANCIVSSHNDHRILMALMLLLLKFGGEIEGAEAVNKSFTDYFSMLRQLNADILLYERT